MKRYTILALLLSMLPLTGISAPVEITPSAMISFGIVPQQSASKLARLWSPICKYLSDKTGYTILFKTAKDIPTFEQRLAKGEYDMAYMSPYHYTIFNNAPGYRAFAKATNAHLQGIIVVRKESPYQTLDDLAGQTLAFPSPTAFAASLLPRAHLTDIGLPFTQNFVASHDSVYHGVARGFFAAGGGIIRTLNNFEPAIRRQLRILWTTQPYTPHAFAAHPHLSTKMIVQVQLAMMDMHREPKGQALLKNIDFQGIESAQDAEWNDARHLGIARLEHLTRR